MGSEAYTRHSMKRRPPQRTFETPSRTVVIEPLDPPVQDTPLTAVPVADDRRDDDAPRSPA
jgi:hypothetical protein